MCLLYTLVEGFGIIYGLRLIDNPEIRYVGLTRTSLDKRWKEHQYAAKYNKRNQAIYMWIKKHGIESIKPFILEITEISSLQDREIYWISKLRSEGDRLLNGTTGGEGGRGRIVSDETRLKISSIHKGKTLSVETKNKLRLANLGSIPWNKGKRGHLSLEARARLSESFTGRVHSDETRKKMSESHSGEKNHYYGKTHSEEVRYKMSLGQHTKWHVNRDIKKKGCKFCNDEKSTSN